MGYLIEGKTFFRGIPITIENSPGSVRSGVDPDGNPWMTKMNISYGRIPYTKGADGEAVDVFLKENNPLGDTVFIMHINDINGNYDEDKVFLGFDTVQEVHDCYHQHYDSNRFKGKITKMSFDEFKMKITDRAFRGKKIAKAFIVRNPMFKSQVKAHQRISGSGNVSMVREHHRAGEKRQLNLFDSPVRQDVKYESAEKSPSDSNSKLDFWEMTKDQAKYYPWRKNRSMLEIGKSIFKGNDPRLESAKKAIQSLKELAKSGAITYYDTDTPRASYQKQRKIAESLGIIIDKKGSGTSYGNPGKHRIEIASGSFEHSFWHEVGHNLLESKQGRESWDKILPGTEWSDRGSEYVPLIAGKYRNDPGYATRQSERYARLFNAYMIDNENLKKNKPTLYAKIERLLDDHAPLIALLRETRDTQLVYSDSWKLFEKIHELSVNQAFSEGKHIPSEVLKDYPLLKNSSSAVKDNKTQSPEFKKWFGNSIVKDSSGNPMVVYHGTGSNFTQFKHGTDQAFYFSPDPDEASRYSEIESRYGGQASVMPVYLRLEKDGYNRLLELQKGQYRKMQEYYSILKKEGFDGFHEPGGMFVVFNPNQIKSATGNSGKYDPNDSDINKSQVRAHERKTAHGVSFVHEYHRKGEAHPGSATNSETDQDESTKPKPVIAKTDPLSIKIQSEYESNVHNVSFHDYVKANVGSLKAKGITTREAAIEHFDKIRFNSFNPKETSFENAISTIRNNISGNTLDGWFRNGDKSYKRRLMDDILSNPKTREAGLKIMHQNYQNSTGKQVDFNEFLNTPVEVFRGGDTESNDPFSSYSFDKSIAEKFGKAKSYMIKPIDTLGSYQTTAETEILIPSFVDVSSGKRSGKLTDTPEFKKWFGKSKVVDDSGNPLVVYHGTASDFTTFDRGKLGEANDMGYTGAGFYFMNDPEWASGYAEIGNDEKGQGGNVLPVYLKMENPLVINSYDDLKSMFPGYKLDAGTDKDNSYSLTQKLQEAGYDGVITRGAGNASDVNEYMVINPNQIKSATGNSGKFDPDNSDINKSQVRAHQRKTAHGVTMVHEYHRNGEASQNDYHPGIPPVPRVQLNIQSNKPKQVDQTDTPEFKKWFGESKVVDESGKPRKMYHGTPNAGFNSFDIKRRGTGRDEEIGGMGDWGDGFYFTPDPDDASAYAMRTNENEQDKNRAVIPVYLKMEKPADLGALKRFDKALLSIIKRKHETMLNYSNETEIEAAKIAGITISEYETLNDVMGSVQDNYDDTKVSRILRKKGYDGIISPDGMEYVVFKPNQIKSATGNVGSFDSRNSDITKSIDLISFRKGNVQAHIRRNASGTMSMVKEHDSGKQAHPDEINVSIEHPKFKNKKMTYDSVERAISNIISYNLDSDDIASIKIGDKVLRLPIKAWDDIHKTEFGLFSSKKMTSDQMFKRYNSKMDEHKTHPRLAGVTQKNLFDTISNNQPSLKQPGLFKGRRVRIMGKAMELINFIRKSITGPEIESNDIDGNDPPVPPEGDEVFHLTDKAIKRLTDDLIKVQGYAKKYRFPDDMIPDLGEVTDIAEKLIRTPRTSEQYFDGESWSDERIELHTQIASEIIFQVEDKESSSIEIKNAYIDKDEEKNKAASGEQEEKLPRFVILAGKPYSGNASILMQYFDPSQYCIISPEMIAQKIPEFEGWNFIQVVEEVRFIIDRFILPAAIKRGLNIVLVTTLNSDQWPEVIRAIKAHNYEIELHHCNVKTDKLCLFSYVAVRNGGIFYPCAYLENADTDSQYYEIQAMSSVDGVSNWDMNNIVKSGPKLIYFRGISSMMKDSENNESEDKGENENASE